MRLDRMLAALGIVLLPALAASAADKYASHAPVRPLPTGFDRPMEKQPGYFVDPVNGDDKADGAQARPWRTVQHAVKQLKPGDTLYLRGGAYYEHVVMTSSGASKNPITIRSFPKELAVIDGGLCEFFEAPEKAWEPCPDGAEGEFRSVKTYTDLGSAGDQTHLLGNFGDSLVPLHGYHFLSDLRSSNIWWNLPKTTSTEGNIYCGPGVYHDLKTGRIHVRLAHTKMPYLPAEDNYQGETDPRKISLVIAGKQGGSPLLLKGVRHVRIQDLVVRGSLESTVAVVDSEDIEFDGMTVFGGSSCFAVKETAGLRLLNSACRGVAAPWTFRGSLKYRAIETRLFSASGWQPTGKESRDLELAWSEFTDSVDGVFVGGVQRVRMHHNLLDNITDDGIFSTAATTYDGVTPGGDIDVVQNRFSRCLTSFAFGVGHGRQKVLANGVQTGAGIHVARNVFDFRRPVHYQQPKGPEDAPDHTAKGRFAGDHGSPAWEPMAIYHNTLIVDDVPRYTYGTWGLGNAVSKGTSRRVFNNIVVQLAAAPGNTFPPATSDFQADGNLFWSVAQGAKLGSAAEVFAKFRNSKAFADSKEKYPPGWGANDHYGDPKFRKFDVNWKENVDFGLQAGSPAIDAGVSVPQEWPDPIRELDKGKPDIGALPLDASPWHVGVRGRLTMFGVEAPLESAPQLPPLQFVPRPPAARAPKPAAIVEGYPAFDVPLLAFALRRQDIPVEVIKHAWLDVKNFDSYGLVALNGSLARAKADPSKFSAEDLKHLNEYMKGGGTLLLTLSGREALRTPEGQQFLADLTGKAAPAKNPKNLEPRILAPEHRWVKHLDPKLAETWVGATMKAAGAALAVQMGENIIGTPDGNSVLYRRRVSEGQLIYIGWQIHDALPFTRDRPSTVAAEKIFEDQMRILLNIMEDVASTKK